MPAKARKNSKSAITKTKAKRAGPVKTANADASSVSKLDAIVAALRKPTGASIAQLQAITGWQPHSVRGAISGALKKQRGLTITSTKADGQRRYRVEGRK